MSDHSPAFQGPIPEYYDRYLRPLLFEPYALDLAARLELKPEMRVLELACGTGIVTRALLGVLPGDATLIATDLSEHMLAVAQRNVPPDPRLTWQPADAARLPFDAASLDAVTCQFGIMFFPDKERSLREMHRVLRSGAQLLFSTWDSVHRNPIARLTREVLSDAFADHPPHFLAVPHGMYDINAIRAMVEAAGFADVKIQAVSAHGHSPSARDTATGCVRGTPLAAELTGHGIPLETAVAVVERAVEAEYGDGEILAPLMAIVVKARA